MGEAGGSFSPKAPPSYVPRPVCVLLYTIFAFLLHEKSRNGAFTSLCAPFAKIFALSGRGGTFNSPPHPPPTKPCSNLPPHCIFLPNRQHTCLGLSDFPVNNINNSNMYNTHPPNQQSCREFWWKYPILESSQQGPGFNVKL